MVTLQRRRGWRELCFALGLLAACGSDVPAEPDAREVEVRSFLDDWSTGGFDDAMNRLDAAASEALRAAITEGDASQFSRPGWYLDASSTTEPADVFTAVARADSALIDLDHPATSVVALDATTLEVEFESRTPVRFELSEEADGWRIRRIDEADATFIGAVFGVADPAAGTGWQWCGDGEPVVLPGVDCTRVLAGLDGITEAERDQIADLRQQSVDDPSQALALTQAMQQILSAAPGQVCRLLQRGEVPAGEAEIRAAELERTVCPAFEPLGLSR